MKEGQHEALRSTVVVVISHNINDVFDIAEKFVALKPGELVGGEAAGGYAP